MKPKLTKLQRELARRIRGLFAHGEPLNICAVKRNHPELMQAVYAIKPFWGWKRALEAAGIDYSKIKVQLEPYVVCRICGQYFASVAWHVRRVHGVDKDDYLMDYPDAESVSEELRARGSKMKNGPLKHWEPLWTPEYVLDRVAEYRRRKLPVNETWLSRHDISFHAQGILCFGSWSKTLAGAGLDPASIYHEFRWRYPRKEDVVEAIRQRHRSGWPLGVAALHFGARQRRDSALVRSGKAYFGSWPAALVAAGIDARRLQQMAFRAHRRYPDGQAVIRELMRRRQAGLAINRVAVDRCPHANKALARSAVEYFGSWNAALKAAGFAPAVIAEEKFRRLRRYPDANAVVREILRRRRAGLPVAGDALYAGPHRDQALTKMARALFSSWRNALKAAGIYPDTIPRQSRWAAK